MANFMAEKLKVKTVYVLDDTGAYGVGHRRRVPGTGRKERRQGARPRPAGPEGGRLLGRPDQDQVAEPGGALLRRRRQAGVKLAKQAYDIIPNVDQGAAATASSAPTCSRAPAFPPPRAGTPRSASPHLIDDTEGRRVRSRPLQGRFGISPDDYTMTAYDGAR